MSDDETVVVSNQYGVEFPVTRAFYMRHKDCPTNPLTLVFDPSVKQVAPKPVVTTVREHPVEEKSTTIVQALSAKDYYPSYPRKVRKHNVGKKKKPRSHDVAEKLKGFDRERKLHV